MGLTSFCKLNVMLWPAPRSKTMRNHNGRPINRWLLLSLVVLISANVMGQDPSMTNGELNGRWWEELGSASHAKETYLAGFIAGVQVGAEEMNRLRGLSDEDKVAEALSNYHANGSTLDDNIKELDKLYAERENIRIPLSAALVYCTIKLGGKFTSAQLEQILIAARKALPPPEGKRP
jgi:hypothetical protein